MVELNFACSFSYVFENNLLLVLLATLYKPEIHKWLKYDLALCLIDSDGKFSH